MCSFGLMMVFANAFLMKSIKTSSPNIAVCVTQASYVCLLFTVDAIIESEVIYYYTLTYSQLVGRVLRRLVLFSSFLTSLNISRRFHGCFLWD